MRPARAKLAIAAILGLVTAAAGCGPSHSSAAAGSSSAPSATPAPAPTTSPAPVAGVTYPGVIADCTSAPAQRLSIRPAFIVLACADNGLGVQKLAWATWGASTATGQGTLWEHICVPYCAASAKSAYYPVTVTLSQVKTSALGQWFSKLTLTWRGKPPPVTTPDAFPLDAPES